MVYSQTAKLVVKTAVIRVPLNNKCLLKAQHCRVLQYDPSAFDEHFRSHIPLKRSVLTPNTFNRFLAHLLSLMIIFCFSSQCLLI